MKTQKGYTSLSAAISIAALIIGGLMVAGCSQKRGYTEGHAKSCFYSEAGIKAESDQLTGLIRTAKEDNRKPSSFLKYRETQNASDLLKAKIKGFWGNMTAPVTTENN